ncbi:uncharacterized protein LOC135501846 [Lineus longissimus]|uniref:uncharacterized protein LOC135501846 n=1 Tax=Lineus longissimus TaxID=88925 RepID=UPI002B4F197A
MSVDFDPDFIELCYQKYNDVLRQKAKTLTKTPRRPKGGDTLLELDSWFQEELPKLMQRREEKYITHEEISKLMVWKLMRGKFRPRLTEMVQENKPEDVISASKKAFKALPNLSKAISALTVLKAVGPATASGILAAGAPEHAPFMADESMLVFPQLQPLDYTLKRYLLYAELVENQMTDLKGKGSEFDWTPHKLELALWTSHTAGQLDIDIAVKGKAPSEKAGKGVGKKRAASTDTDPQNGNKKSKKRH